MARKLGKIIKKLPRLYAWVENQELTKAVHSSYAPDRLEKWWRMGSNLQSISAGRAQIFSAPEPPLLITRLGDRLLPGWHSILVCGGDTTINWHRDHGHFEAIAVMINLGKAWYKEQPLRNLNTENNIFLGNGDVIEINTKLLHSAMPLNQRFNITFRKIKPQFL